MEIMREVWKNTERQWVYEYETLNLNFKTYKIKVKKKFGTVRFDSVKSNHTN